MKLEAAFIAVVLLALAESAVPRILYEYREFSNTRNITLEESVNGDTEFHLEFPVATQMLKNSSLRITRYIQYHCSANSSSLLIGWVLGWYHHREIWMVGTFSKRGLEMFRIPRRSVCLPGRLDAD